MRCLYAHLNVRSTPLHPCPITLTVLADGENGHGLGVGEIDGPVSLQLRPAKGSLGFHAGVCSAFALAKEEQAAACGDFRPTKILLMILFHVPPTPASLS